MKCYATEPIVTHNTCRRRLASLFPANIFQVTAHPGNTSSRYSDVVQVIMPYRTVALHIPISR